MREIKFRAWDGKKVFDFFGATPKALEMYADRPKNIKKIMQYTGLKDKNGVEIYEGDIVKIHNQGYRLIEIISFYDGAFCLKHKSIEEYETLHYFNDYFLIEVIGNIYENKELLGD